MKQKLTRTLVVVALVAAAWFAGYSTKGGAHAPPNCTSAPRATVAVPAAGSVRVLYSLDKKENDKELVALIDDARTKAYFAVYEFTLEDVADALVRAKKRGLDVRGLVDATEAASSYDQPIIGELAAAGIPVETQKHADGNGIMHNKALVTDRAYAIGSYNFIIGVDVNQAGQVNPTNDPYLTYIAEFINGVEVASYGTTGAGTGGTALTIANNGNGWADDLITGFVAPNAGDTVYFKLSYYNATDGAEEFFLINTANPPPAVPEPSSLMLFGTGLLGMAGFLRRRLLG